MPTGIYERKPRSHGRCKTPIYRTWAQMIQRCENPKNPFYRRYGGRGIIVCERWHEFLNFLQDMGERPLGRTLDRINNDGNYEPGNCRWATPKEQQRMAIREKCIRGHVYAETGFWDCNGDRRCRECVKIRAKKVREKKANLLNLGAENFQTKGGNLCAKKR